MCNLYSLNKNRDTVGRFFRVSHNRIVGAAVIESATTTVLLRPGDYASTTALGWLDIHIETPT